MKQPSLCTKSHLNKTITDSVLIASPAEGHLSMLLNTFHFNIHEATTNNCCFFTWPQMDDKV